jgi:hypothetical protein
MAHRKGGRSTLAIGRVADCRKAVATESKRSVAGPVARDDPRLGSIHLPGRCPRVRRGHVVPGPAIDSGDIGAGAGGVRGLFSWRRADGLGIAIAAKWTGVGRRAEANRGQYREGNQESQGQGQSHGVSIHRKRDDDPSDRQGRLV